MSNSMSNQHAPHTMQTQARHVSKRSAEIESTFQTRQEEIRSDLEALDLSVKQLTEKYNVSERFIRRWSERLGLDSTERNRKRRQAGLDPKTPQTRTRTKRDDSVRSASLLSMKW